MHAELDFLMGPASAHWTWPVTKSRSRTVIPLETKPASSGLGLVELPSKALLFSKKTCLRCWATVSSTMVADNWITWPLGNA
uniref:Uncharacterized protein n=1 Tax=Panagrellus redivivus TaxID=6233 RepID=A0A7E4UYV9_PANRE